MFDIIAYDCASFGDYLTDLVRSSRHEDPQLIETVRAIIADVRARGDSALIDYTARLDNHTVDSIEQLTLRRDQLGCYLDLIDPEVYSALLQAKERITWFHRHQIEQSWIVQDDLGNTLGQRIIPIERAGLYVPGGRAAYPSSVLMNAIPAKVAGVGHLSMVMPCPDAVHNPVMLAAAALCEVDQVVLIGGAQAIAALAWGTQSIASVDKITGPGNAYVAEAKRQVFGHTGIDMIAGPSEIVIIADGSCHPTWVALDMCAQAEHDPDARSILISHNKAYIKAVQQAIEQELVALGRADIIRRSLAAHGAAIVCRDLEQACLIADTIAPEHLELLVEDAATYVDKIHNAGAVFVGHWSCEAVGDYCAGPNHILPTTTSARFSSPLGVYDFVKRSSYIECSRQGVSRLLEISSRLGREEGLDAHARSTEIRMGNAD